MRKVQLNDLKFNEHFSLYSSSLNTQEFPTTVTLANICIKKDNRTKTTNQFLQVLLDSGASKSLIKS